MVDAARNSYLVFIRYAASGRVILTRRVLICPNRINRARLIVLNRATEIEENVIFLAYTVISALSIMFIIRDRIILATLD